LAIGGVETNVHDGAPCYRRGFTSANTIGGGGVIGSMAGLVVHEHADMGRIGLGKRRKRHTNQSDAKR